MVADIEVQEAAAWVIALDEQVEAGKTLDDLLGEGRHGVEAKSGWSPNFAPDFPTQGAMLPERGYSPAPVTYLIGECSPVGDGNTQWVS